MLFSIRISQYRFCQGQLISSKPIWENLDIFFNRLNDRSHTKYISNANFGTTIVFSICWINLYKAHKSIYYKFLFQKKKYKKLFFFFLIHHFGRVINFTQKRKRWRDYKKKKRKRKKRGNWWWRDELL